MTSSIQLHRINHNTTTSTTTHAGNFHKQPVEQPTRIIIPITNNNIFIPNNLIHYHAHAVAPKQCCSAVVQSISATIDTVWSTVRRFDNPQTYKHFLKSCQLIVGNGQVGSLREVHVISGLPAASSIERLEILDDENYVMSFSVVGGDHRLNNYRSVTTLHRTVDDEDHETTIVVESYVVDVPTGNTKEETCIFVDTIVRCNLQSLAHIAENLEKTKI